MAKPFDQREYICIFLVCLLYHLLCFRPWFLKEIVYWKMSTVTCNYCASPQKSYCTFTQQRYIAPLYRNHFSHCFKTINTYYPLFAPITSVINLQIHINISWTTFWTCLCPMPGYKSAWLLVHIELMLLCSFWLVCWRKGQGPAIKPRDFLLVLMLVCSFWLLYRRKGQGPVMKPKGSLSVLS